MLSNRNGLLGEPKYRICKCPGSDRKKIVFFCDWDYVHSPKTSFLGKPVYFQQPRTANLPFRTKEIAGEIYLDLSKIRPQGVYVCDLGLRLVCENLASGLLINNSQSVLQTLCLVSMDCVVREICSTSAKQELCLQNEKSKQIMETLQTYLGESYEFGIVGYHALNPLCDDNELDLVIIADTVEQLNLRRKEIDRMPNVRRSIYISEIWPLSKRTTNIGSLDFFYSTRNSPSQILSRLETARILELHFEFDSTIIDDSMGILGIPMWKTGDGSYIIGIDNALRGRLRISDRVIGIGISAMIDSEKVVIIQSAGNISHVVH